MTPLLGMARLIFKTIPDLLLSGWSALLMLLAVLLVFWQYRRVAVTEAELYGIPKHSALTQTGYSLWVGMVGGVLGSFLFALTGIGLVDAPGAPSALLYLWPLSIGLGAFNPRFLCFAYGATLLALSHLITGWPHIDVPQLTGLIAIMHMVEAFLIWASGDSCATPISIDRNTAEPIPGFALQRFWPVPLILPWFTVVGGAPVDMPGWWPLLRPDPQLVGVAGSLNWGLLPVVVTLSYTDLAIAGAPQQRTQQSSRALLLYSGILLLLAVGASRFPPLVWAAALFSGIGHEAMAVLAGRLQMLGTPYLQRPPRGVGVLDVLPGSTAEAGGLRTGAVILTVDDLEVHSKAELHDALMASPAYVRIMYRVGHQLEHCRIPRPPEGLFSFGAIVLPESGDRPLVKLRRPSFFRRNGLEQ
ncbi:MAG: hypothetical protein ACM3XM_08555 [Mycobacterium leprae]